jgi:hypothetical protein
MVSMPTRSELLNIEAVADDDEGAYGGAHSTTNGTPYASQARGTEMTAKVTKVSFLAEPLLLIGHGVQDTMKVVRIENWCCPDTIIEPSGEGTDGPSIELNHQSMVLEFARICMLLGKLPRTMAQEPNPVERMRVELRVAQARLAAGKEELACYRRMLIEQVVEEYAMDDTEEQVASWLLNVDA